MYKYLNNINSPEDIKNLNSDELDILCAEIRNELMDTISKNGGHLASNLGVVELTVALHRSFNFNKDKDSLIFDVGHQCYTHKLITGRFKKFNTIRKKDGLTGFMRPSESDYDAFVTGHSSNSVSAAVGICKANQLLNNNNYSVAVVGDGAMTGGMFYEGLNNGGNKNNKLIIILNDNKMSISKNVGGLARYLTIIRSKPEYHKFKHKLERAVLHIPFLGKRIRNNLLRSKNMLKNAVYHSNLFEDMGFHYFGPVDGHNIQKMESILDIAKKENRPAVIHILTKKGKGYEYAEENPQYYHGMSAFNIDEGGSEIIKTDFSFIAGDELCNMAFENNKICTVTAAMRIGTGLDNFARKFKNRFFDVGIAEQHAITFAAGLASKCFLPFVAIYSSFLQRGLDQIIHDVAIEKYPVTLLVDRAGLVGEDGETHQGIFDIPFLKEVPGIKIYSPSNYSETRHYINFAGKRKDGVIAIRYPRGKEQFAKYDTDNKNNLKNNSDDLFEDYFIFNANNKNAKKAIISFGRLFDEAYKAYLNNKSFCLIKLNLIYPIKTDLFEFLNNSDFEEIHIFEESIKSGGIGEYISSNINKNKAVIIHAVNNRFVKQASVEQQLIEQKLSLKDIEDVL